jgi:hypothetical protein
MYGVITGNIINSQKYDAKFWLPTLKHTLSQYGVEPKNWEIFRGDNFQLEINKPELTLLVAIHIKAAIKQVKGPDVRMAIGIGEKEHNSRKISENNGSAYLYSNEEFHNLKQSMSIKTPWTEFNNEINIYLALVLIIIDGWTPNAAKTINTIFESNSPLSQAEIGQKLGIKQSGTSQRLSRAHYKEIIEFEELFCKNIKQLITS